MNRDKKNSVESEVIRMVKKRLSDSGFDSQQVEILPGTHIRKDLGFDSLMTMVLQIDLEDAYRFRFHPADEDLQAVFSTVEALCAYIEKQLEERHEL